MKTIAIAALAAVLALPALAQDTVIVAEPFVVTILPFVTTITVALIGALVPLVAAYVKTRWNLDWEKAHRDAFQTSLTNGAGLLIQKAGDALSAGKIDVRSPAMAEAIRYVQNGAPDAIKAWGITPERIATAIVAKIPQVENSGAPVVR